MIKRLKYYLLALWYAFYSPSFYVRWIEQGRGFCFGFMFLLSYTAALPVLSELFHWSTVLLKEDFIKPLSLFPMIEIDDGQVKFEHMMPYFIYDTDQKMVAIIDTTNTIRTIDHQVFPELKWLLLKNQLYYRPVGQGLPDFLSKIISAQPMRSIDLSADGVLNFQEILISESIESKLSYFIAVLLYSFPFFLSSIVFVFLLSFSWAAQFFSKVIFQQALSFSEAFRALLLAMTPSTLLFFWAMALGYCSFYYSALLWCLFIIYFSLSMIALKKSHRQISIHDKSV